MKKGLILEGGAMRGMFTAGVMDVMMEYGILFDGVIGVSAGAVFGCNYKSHQPGRAIRYNKKYCRDPRYASIRSLLRTGDLYGSEFCYHELPERLDPFDQETFAASPMEFYAVSTDVETGRAVYHKCTDGGAEDLRWLQASASMPIVSRIVEAGGRKLLDGGISDSIPLRYFEHIGYDRNVVVLTQPADYRKKKNKMMPLIRTNLHRYPNTVAALARRHVIYNKTVRYICKKEQQGEVFVIRPPKALPVKSVEKDPEKLELVYQMGRRAMRSQMEELISFLN